MEHVPEDWSRALALVAHPDDLEFGAASAIARWTSMGKRVVEVIATRGEAGIQSMAPDQAGPLREAEQRAAARVVGVDTVEFLDHRDGVIENGLPLRRDLAVAIRRHRPEVVVSLNFRETWPGGRGFNFADHRAFGPALIDAVRDAANPWLFPGARAARAGEESEETSSRSASPPPEPWQGVRFALFTGSPQAEHYVDVTGHLDTGIASLRAHKVYLENLADHFDPADFLRSGAEVIGRRVGVRHGVSFELIPL